MSDLQLYSSFVDAFEKKVEQISSQKEMYRLESYWINLEGHEFEKEVARWYITQGYDAKVTKPSKDGGVDIVLTKNNVQTFVQCKHYKEKKIGVRACRELGGVMFEKRVNKGAIVTLKGVTKYAKDYCRGRITIVTLRTLLRSHKDAHIEHMRAQKNMSLPFRSNLPMRFEEREVYGYYIYGNTFHDLEQVSEEIAIIPIANLTNLCDTKAIIKYKDCFFIIYSSAEKIKWLGNYVLKYMDALSGELVSPKSLQ